MYFTLVLKNILFRYNIICYISLFILHLFLVDKITDRILSNFAISWGTLTEVSLFYQWALVITIHSSTFFSWKFNVTVRQYFTLFVNMNPNYDGEVTKESNVVTMTLPLWPRFKSICCRNSYFHDCSATVNVFTNQGKKIIIHWLIEIVLRNNMVKCTKKPWEAVADPRNQDVFNFTGLQKISKHIHR